MKGPRIAPGGWFVVLGRGAWWRAILFQIVLIWLLPWLMMLVGRMARPGPEIDRHTPARAMDWRGHVDD